MSMGRWLWLVLFIDRYMVMFYWLKAYQVKKTKSVLGFKYIMIIGITRESSRFFMDFHGLSYLNMILLLPSFYSLLSPKEFVFHVH